MSEFGVSCTSPGLMSRVVSGLRYAVTGVAPADWFGPSVLVQAQIDTAYVAAGIKTADEVRASLGLGGLPSRNVPLMEDGRPVDDGVTWDWQNAVDYALSGGEVDQSL